MRMQEMSLREKAWRVIFGAFLALSVSGCGSSQGSDEGGERGDEYGISAGGLVHVLGAESDWRLTMKPESGGGSGVKITIMDAAPDKPIDPSSADFGSHHSLSYLLSFELRDGRLRRCIARHPEPEGGFVGAECRLDDHALVVKIGQGRESGRIVFEFTPAGIAGDGNELTGEAKMEHPGLPMDLTIGRAVLVRIDAREPASSGSGAGSGSAHDDR